MPDEDCWAFYLHIRMDAVPDRLRDEFWLNGSLSNGGRHVDYDYMGSVLSQLDWHCGITWYSKTSGFDGALKTIKVGCDYQHYCDERHSYNVEYVHGEAVACIDSLFELIPDMKVWCSGCGELYLPEDGCICKWYAAGKEKESKGKL